MGGLVETQLSRAIAVLERRRRSRRDRPGRRRREADQPDAGRPRPDVQPDHRQAAAGGDRPAVHPDDHQDRQRARARRRRGEEDRLQGGADPWRRSAEPRPPLRRDPHGGSARARCCRWRSTRSRGSTPRAAAEVIDARRGDRRRVPRDHAPAHQLHDGGSAHDQRRRSRSCSSRSRSSASATTRRTSPRRSSRSSRASTSGTRPRDADPRRGRRGMSAWRQVQA